MIANRYEVFQHIGQGGMADVFLAIDTILNRQVAVKILRSELCTDTVSVLRFEREAQAATALSHPNIVEIYDVGEYKGHHYIVMEYVPGKTLKKVIQQRGALLKEEAVDIMKQLTSATAEAHRRGIIHRDIKPQNCILKSDGSIKILDFGIALAKGSMQLTQANNVMGSVHYLAPELAKGESATAQSDIYALGIVLFEMLTGDVPFKAEQAVQVALMQMRNEMPDVRSINPDIPQSVANIIIRATAKDPAQRYHSCNEMLEDLQTCLRPERLNEPKIKLVSKPQTVQKADSRGKVKSTEDTDAEVDRIIRQQKKTDGTRVSRPAVQKKVRTNRLLLALLIFLLLILAASGIYYASTSLFSPAARNTAVPEIVGMTITDAKALCTDSDLVLDTANVTYQLTEDTEKGLIISVSPKENEEVEKGSRVTITVSSGIGIRAKDYTGMNIREAEEDLSQYKYMNISTEEEDNPSVESGTVIRQELLAPDTLFNPATSCDIRLVFASYPTIVIPETILNMTLEEAHQYLEGLGASVLDSNLDMSSFSDEEKANLPTGVVINTEPAAGSEYTQREDNFILLYYY